MATTTALGRRCGLHAPSRACPLDSVRRAPCPAASPLLLPRQHQHLLSGQPSSSVACPALRRQVQPVYFPDVYQGLAEKIAQGRSLPKSDTLVMLASIQNIEHAKRALVLLDRHLQNRVTAEAPDDWYLRIKYLRQLCDVAAVKLRQPQLVLDIFANAQRFQLSTYFVQDMIVHLEAQDVPSGVLVRMLELVRLQRGLEDKGVKAAYKDLKFILKKRKEVKFAEIAEGFMRPLPIDEERKQRLAQQQQGQLGPQGQLAPQGPQGPQAVMPAPMAAAAPMLQRLPAQQPAGMMVA